MKIGIVPRIRIIRNSVEYCVEEKLISFLRKIYKNCSIIILDNCRKNIKIDMLIISGGNDLTKFSKAKDNLIKEKITKFYLNKAIKKKITVVGICYGAQFIAKHFNSKFAKTKRHVGNHILKFESVPFNFKLKKISNTNSFHNYLIKKTGSKLITLARAMDNSIEAFKHLKFKI